MMSVGAVHTERAVVPARVTVRDVLRLPCLACAEVVAGAAGLDRPVRWIHVSELLDIARWLTGGEFLLTTGMKLKEIEPSEQRAYALSLARSGLAALGLELVLWLSEPPAALVEVFEAQGVPLIVWRQDLRFSAITEEVTRLLFERRNSGPRIDEADLAEELLSGETLEPLLRERLELGGVALGEWLTVMVFDIARTAGQGTSALRAALINTLRAIVPPARRGAVPTDAARVACSDRGRLIKLVLTGSSFEALLAACDRIAAAVQREMSRCSSGSRILVGVGRPRTCLGELPDALREAAAVMRFQSRTLQGRIHFDEIRLARLLLSVSSRELRRLVQEELGPVLVLPPSERDELLRTLNALLEENFNVAAAARRLHLRRQSLYRRMEKLEGLLGPGLDRCERRTILLLALRARELFGGDRCDGRTDGATRTCDL